jgi:hypothetical protein
MKIIATEVKNRIADAWFLNKTANSFPPFFCSKEIVVNTKINNAIVQKKACTANSLIFRIKYPQILVDKNIGSTTIKSRTDSFSMLKTNLSNECEITIETVKINIDPTSFIRESSNFVT